MKPDMNYTKEYIESFRDGWEALSSYIVVKAAFDYRSDFEKLLKNKPKLIALKKQYDELEPGVTKQKLKHRIKRLETEIALTERDIVQIETFFESDDHKLYTKVDGKAILKKLKREIA